MPTYEIPPYTKAKSKALANAAQAEADKAQEGLNLDAMTPSELEAITHPKLKPYAPKPDPWRSTTTGQVSSSVAITPSPIPSPSKKP